MKTVAISLLLTGLTFSAAIQTRGESGPGPILYDTFDAVTPFAREAGVHNINVYPQIGPAGMLRYYEPGYWGLNGSTNASHINFSGSDPIRGRYLSINYSGSDNGGASQDQVMYPIGSQMKPEEGTIAFLYRPHYDQSDASAQLAIISAKDRNDLPYDVYREDNPTEGLEFLVGWTGWEGRKNFFVVFQQVKGGNTEFRIVFGTPPEYSPDRIVFPAEQWMQMMIVWKKDGIAALGGKTMALLINGKVVASTSERLSPSVPFRKYFMLSGGAGCPFVQGSPLGCYSGPSGDLDEVRVYDYSTLDAVCDGTPAKVESVISRKTGNQEARRWTVTLNDRSFCPASNAKIDSITLIQTYGAACTPVIMSPKSFPISMGDIQGKGTASADIIINFSQCPSNARFTARIAYSFDNGAVKKVVTLNNQFR